MADEPFFILGCVRSGTTFLRNVLRRHPQLAAPEETHFYRWSDPFGTAGFSRFVQSNKILKRHRELDGISEEAFANLLAESTSRADLYRRYMRQFMALNKPGASRWFDKTPQNVYGAAMITSEFPAAKFVHIVRNPLDVVASLKQGKVMHVPQLVGACNYWREAIEIMRVIKRSSPRRVYVLKYEDLAADPLRELKSLFAFLRQEYDPTIFGDVEVKKTRHDHAVLFTPQEKARILRMCQRLAAPYGYFDA